MQPGWYARTPDGQTESWWDGERWTGQTRPTPGTEPPYQETPKERIARRMVYGGLAAIAGVVIITIAAIALDGSSSDRDEPDEPDAGMSEGEARYVCEEFVKDRLKAPGTADFQRPDLSGLTNGRWQVEGTVDSENGFGALIRSSYSCTVREAGDGSATLLELDISE